MTQYARYESKSCRLSEDFARGMVERHFGQAAAELIFKALPTLKSGPRKGMVKGYVRWKKVTEGGWSWAKGGGVIRPGTQDVSIGSSYDTMHEEGLPASRFRDGTMTEWSRASVIATWLSSMFPGEVDRDAVITLSGAVPPQVKPWHEEGNTPELIATIAECYETTVEQVLEWARDAHTYQEAITLLAPHLNPLGQAIIARNRVKEAEA